MLGTTLQVHKEEWLAATTAEAEALAKDATETGAAVPEASTTFSPPPASLSDDSPTAKGENSAAVGPVDTTTAQKRNSTTASSWANRSRPPAAGPQRLKFKDVFDVNLDLDTWELGSNTNRGATKIPLSPQLAPGVAAATTRAARAEQREATNRKSHLSPHKRGNMAHRADRIAPATVVADSAAVREWFLE
jgi:hypothetical protein